MARTNFLWIAFLFFINVNAQDYSYGFLVEFTDKNETNYSTENPLEYLSQKAIDRRIKYNISITEEDFPVNEWYADSLEYYGAHLHNASKWMNSAVYFTDNSQFGSDVASVSFVQSTRLIYNYGKKASKTLNKFSQEENLNNVKDANYGASENQITMCNGQVLHNNGFNGQGMTIAVIDGGFWHVNELNCFDSLFANNQILGTYDFVRNEESVYEDHDHGQKVLSIIASNLPGQLMGSAPKAEFWLLRSEQVATEYPVEEEYWIFAAEFADSAGADLITTSLGYSEFDDPDMNWTYNDMDGVTTRITQGAEKAFSKGMFLVNSAGNSGSDPWKYITAPSDGEHVLCVGAVDAYGEVAYFSSNGPAADGRVKPDAMGQGYGTALYLADNSVSYGSGTSFSCPLMAGLVTCLWQVNTSLSNLELLQLVQSVGDRYKTPDALYGYGIPDFEYAKFLLENSDLSAYNASAMISIYPNPFQSQLKFSLYVDKAQAVNISLYNMLGQKIYTIVSNFDTASVQLITMPNVEILERGTYILSIETADKILSNLIVKE